MPVVDGDFEVLECDAAAVERLHRTGQRWKTLSRILRVTRKWRKLTRLLLILSARGLFNITGSFLKNANYKVLKDKSPRSR